MNLPRPSANSLRPAAGGNDYIAKFREFKYQETLFDLFARQFEVAKVDESKEGAVIQTVDAATPPERKSKPRKAVIAIIATVAAGFLLLVFVFIRHALRNVSSDEDPVVAGKLARLRQALRGVVARA
ncbi:GNVR domain-containing protein [Xylophilus sp.]|uniref:GNVR domain-containing protein n=1 Tax=Xylophilus sp. TaxID=2653893 RepID=UPI002D804125|nr:GNVR domain-containing protein [Xylophilus sp.]